jgi:hypothetical protein
MTTARRMTTLHTDMRLLPSVVVFIALVLGACSPKANPSMSGCGSTAVLSISPIGVRATPSSDALITGTVTGAPCGVRGVSVMSSVSATAVLTSFASWSATVPAAVIDRAPKCQVDAGVSQKTGVQLHAEALVISDSGRADLALTQSQCVTLPTAVGEACGPVVLTCAAPPGASAGTECPLPVSSNVPLSIGIFSDSGAVGKQVTWKGAEGLVSISPSPASLRAPSADEIGICQGRCSGSLEVCGATVSASVVGVNPGIDFISATVDGYAGSIAVLPVAIQGPVKLAASSAQFTTDTVSLLSVANPMAFHQDCLFTIPQGVHVDRVANDGSEALVASCPFSSAGSDAGPPCVAAVGIDDRNRTYALSFSLGISDTTARAVGLNSTSQVSVVCTDKFGQAANLTINATWTFLPDAGV